jgi:hypothetical protein
MQLRAAGRLPPADGRRTAQRTPRNGMLPAAADPAQPPGVAGGTPRADVAASRRSRAVAAGPAPPSLPRTPSAVSLACRARWYAPAQPLLLPRRGGASAVLRCAARPLRRARGTCCAAAAAQTGPAAPSARRQHAQLPQQQLKR